MSLNAQELRVCQLIAARRAALLADLRLHVETPTGCGHAPGLARTREVLCDRARRLGATIQLVDGDPRPTWLYGQSTDPATAHESRTVALCRREYVASAPPALITGHLDTVHDPRGPFQKLIISPDGKRAVGPGCVDMKGGLVIGLAALECLEESGVRLPWTLLLNSDEETGSYHSQRIIFEEAARVAKLGGVGIALEPAGGGAKSELVVERAGSGQFCIEVHGKSAHVGRDFASGVSAVNALARLILRIAELSDPAEGIIVNIGPIEGGHATNVVPDRARAWGNVRFPTAEAAAALTERIRALAGGQVTPGLSVEVATSFGRAAKPITPEVERLAEIARTISEQMGRPLPFGKTAGVCDGNIMQSAGLPTLDTLGVRGGGLHTPEEWLELDSLVDRCQLLAVLLMRATAGAGSR